MATLNRSSFAGTGSPANAPAALRGRGAVANVLHRFDSVSRVAMDDGWAHGNEGDDTAPVVCQTVVESEQARRLISRNVSPDIPFEAAVNPYRGCEHGCVYCFARPTHAYLGYSPGLDFETRLIAKQNAVSVLRSELARPGYVPSPINIGSATDVYQPIERDWRLTRGLLELMRETGHPCTLVTKNALVERDLDVLRDLARDQLVAVYVSVTSMDNLLSSKLEPRASAPWRRMRAIRTLADAGVPVGVLVAPVIPFVTDEHLEHVLQAAGQAGASSASYTVIRLPYEVKEIFQAWLLAHYPDRAERVLHRIEDMREGKRNDPRFGSRMRGTGIWADLLQQRFELALRRFGLNRKRLPLNSHLFVPPVADTASGTRRTPRPVACETVQLGLFD